MRLLDKLRSPADARVAPPTSAARLARAPAPQPPSGRASNGLREFLRQLDEVQSGHLLDLGCVSQQTVSFFTDRGFRVYTEDLLRSWKEHLAAEEERLRAAPVGDSAEAAGDFDRVALAERFARACLQYPEERFHAVLLWDVLDYLDGELLPHVIGRLHGLLRPGGVLLGLFHSRKPAAFHRYRVFDAASVELLPAPALFPPARIFQNRELLNLFAAFRSSRTFVGRDQIREGLFLK